VSHETIYTCIYAEPLRLSETPDQDREMAQNKELTRRTGMAVYFCDPHSPWQRGSNESTFGRVRQYLPKGIDLSVYSQAELDAIATRSPAVPARAWVCEPPWPSTAICSSPRPGTPLPFIDNQGVALQV